MPLCNVPSFVMPADALGQWMWAASHFSSNPLVICDCLNIAIVCTYKWSASSSNAKWTIGRSFYWYSYQDSNPVNTFNLKYPTRCSATGRATSYRRIMFPCPPMGHRQRAPPEQRLYGSFLTYIHTACLLAVYELEQKLPPRLCLFAPFRLTMEAFQENSKEDLKQIPCNRAPQSMTIDAGLLVCTNRERGAIVARASGTNCLVHLHGKEVIKS